MISRKFGLWTALVLSFLLLASGCRSNNPGAELSGMVEAREVDVAAKIPGRVVELKVEEGDTVKEGQVIAVIEAKELEDKKRQAEAQLSAAQAQCQKARDALLLQQKLSDADYQAAQAALDRALAEYNKVSEGTRTQIEQAQAKLEEAKAQLSLAEKTFQRYQQLYSAGAVPQQALDEVKAKYEAARQQVRQAEEGLEFLKGVAQEEDVRAARAAVSQAQAALLKAEAGRMQTLLAQGDLAAAEAKRQQAEAALAEVKHSLEDAVIKAPCDGIVVTKYVQKGELVATGALIVTIQQPSRNWADFKVNEKLVSKFKEGQQVKISSPDLPGKTFTGKVESINRKPDYAARRPTHERGEKELVAYNVKVRLDNPELRAGMTVILHLP